MTDEPYKRKRTDGLGYFNLLRGIGLVLVIFGHSMTIYRGLSTEKSAVLFSGAGSVLGGGIMAAFFMISGYGFFRRRMRKCVSIQYRLLLRPYIVTAFAVLLTKLLLALIKQRSFSENGGELVAAYLFGLNAEGGGVYFGFPVESVSIFWFILALFGGWLIYNGVEQISQGRIRAVIICGCIVMSWILTLISKVWPYCFPMMLLAAGYLAAGAFIKKHRLLERKLSWRWWTPLIAVSTASAAFGEVNIVACEWKTGLLDVAGSFCMGFIYLKLYAWFMEKDHNGRFTAILEEVGLRSIWIVCIHAYEKTVFPWYQIARLLPGHPVYGTIVCFVSRCIVMYIIYRAARQGYHIMKEISRLYVRR